MTEDGVKDIGRSESLIDMIQEQILDMVGDLSDYAIQLKGEGGPPSFTGLRKQLKDLREAMVVLLQERTRLDELRQKYSGAVDGAVIDFDAARSEVGRLLDRVRDAAGAEDVSG